ncbi:MAG TPA: hypothetical protein VGQ83_31600, partial [Polyangia bacterium]
MRTRAKVIVMFAAAAAALAVGVVASAQNLNVAGNTTGQGNAYFLGNVGIGTTAPGAKLEVKGGHGDTVLRLYSLGDGGANSAYLNFWASEPGWTYTGVGIGNNMINGYYGRIQTTRGASYIRLLDNQIYFNTVTGTGADVTGLAISSGRVGIGTTSPASKLDVSVVSGDPDITNLRTSYSGSRDGVISYGWISGSNVDGWRISQMDHGTTTNRGDLVAILSTGNVGIGTMTPGAKLAVNTGDNSLAAILATNDEGPGELRVRSYTTQPVNVASFGIVHSFYGDENNGFLRFYRGSGTAGGFLTFGTSGAERLRLDSSGNVGIGTSAPAYTLHVNGTAAGTSWTNLSSREFKDDVRKVPPARHGEMLARLMALDLATY